eukprot:TRINITY_DN3904_c1_g1_i1.p1 TRINITY_DN3904_c1_g1~~TRINITY_DN3904_c1_g1_i1.p1  ORF type:complete len:177 (-),score=32.98 TRINITY_DN3904_c1_g1_i1:125-655(-)
MRRYNNNNNNNKEHIEDFCDHSFILHPEEDCLYCEDCGRVKSNFIKLKTEEVKRLCWHYFFFNKCYRPVCKFSHVVTCYNLLSGSVKDSQDFDSQLLKTTLCIHNFKGDCGAKSCKYSHSLTYENISLEDQISFGKWEENNARKTEAIKMMKEGGGSSNFDQNNNNSNSKWRSPNV